MNCPAPYWGWAAPIITGGVPILTLSEVGDLKDFKTSIINSMVGNPRHPNSNSENKKFSAILPSSAPIIIDKTGDTKIKAPRPQVNLQPKPIPFAGRPSLFRAPRVIFLADQ